MQQQQSMLAFEPSFEEKKIGFSELKRSYVLSGQDNAQPHIAKYASQIKELCWEKTPHPPYFPNFASSDYHLFHSLQNHLQEITFTSHERIKTDITKFKTKRVLQ